MRQAQGSSSRLHDELAALVNPFVWTSAAGLASSAPFDSSEPAGCWPRGAPLVDLPNRHVARAVVDDGLHDAVAPTARSAWRPSANSSTIFAQNAGRSSGLRLDTSPSSTTTS